MQKSNTNNKHQYGMSEKVIVVLIDDLRSNPRLLYGLLYLT